MLAATLAACNSAPSVTPDPCNPNPCAADHPVCSTSDKAAVCGCAAGSHDVAGVCTLDGGCSGNPCNGHGTCAESGGVATCTCDPGFALPGCSTCAAGLHDDGKGGCSADPCTPNPCNDPTRHCVAQNGAGVCTCAPGFHDDGGVCVGDTICSPTSCNAHGQCDDASGKALCTCDPGWSGVACAACDSAKGYHSDGAGGCTQDVCKPNPCVTAHRTVCSADITGPACGCDAGYHLEGLICVIDDTCQAGSCSGHGTCSIVGGKVSCVCGAGYSGGLCASCASGYHSDGAGGCTTDLCTPSPCTAAHMTVCTGGACGCDVGYHSDGAGGCSNDPCTPNPCLASNQACRVVSGAAQCYTPPCDDMNPCTVDAVVGGNCQHTPLGDTTTCQTSLCVVGQTCLSGVCQGGGARDCNDSNACTDDACSTTLGCTHTNNDGNVPADSYACTTDSCVGGVAKHVASDPACDDALWCTGVEKCQPGAGADSRGCVHTNVPAPPYLGPCRTAGSCNEATHDFSVANKAPGTACSDGVACTTGDSCDGSGACRGTATGACAGGSCATTTPWSSTIDVSWGDVTGSFKLNGGAMPPTNVESTGASLYLRSQDTQVMHYIGSYYYSGTGPYTLAKSNYAARVIVGLYDVIYARSCGIGSTCYVDTPVGAQANGYRVLRTGLVIGTGLNVVDIDIPTTNVSGTFKLNGGAMPTTNVESTGASLYLRAQDTQVMHYIGNYYYSGTGPYTLAKSTYAARVVAGTYDVVYARSCGIGSTCYVDTPVGNQASGYRVLGSVAISGLNQTLDIDIPTTNVSGMFKLNGGAMPTTNVESTGASLYLRAQDTRVMHYIGNYYYSGTGPYTLAKSTYAARVIAGTYDVVYARSCGIGSTCYVDTPAGNQANGYRVLGSVAISGLNQTLDIDIHTTDPSGSFGLNGDVMPPTNVESTGASLYFRSKDTQVMHYIGSYYYSGTGPYSLAKSTYAARVVAGTYDVVYARSCGIGSTCYVDTSAGNQANGYRVLQSCMSVP